MIPNVFLFPLTKKEAAEAQSLRSQSVILKRGEHRKFLPYAFTEQGVAMLFSVLRSRQCRPFTGVRIETLSFYNN